jgi:PKD repeat protein
VNLTYYWDFGDGSGFQVAGINATHIYEKPGDYTIRLRIEDDDHEVDIKKRLITVLAPQEDEDIFANPTFENKGMYIYTGMAIFIVILLIILISLYMYYTNKGGMFGKIERVIEERRTTKAEQMIPPSDRVNVIGPTGLSVEQENFYKDMYGVHPGEVQSIYQMQGQGQGQNMNMPSNNQIVPPIPPPPGMEQQMPMQQFKAGPVLPILPPAPDKKKEDINDPDYWKDDDEDED